MTFAHGVTVTFLQDNPGGYDPYGDPNAGSIVETEVDGCAVAPRMSTEPDARGRNGVLVGLDLYIPAGHDISHAVRARIESGPYTGTWEIDGNPADWTSPFSGWAPGTVVPLKLAEG